MPPDTWNLSETQGNVFDNPRRMLDPSQTPDQGILHSTNQSDTGGIPVYRRLVAKGEEQIGSTVPMPSFARRPSTINLPYQRKYHRIPWLTRKDCKSRSFILLNSPHLQRFQLEDKIQNPGKFFFRFSLEGNVVDPRSGDGRFSG